LKLRPSVWNRPARPQGIRLAKIIYFLLYALCYWDYRWRDILARPGIFAPAVSSRSPQSVRIVPSTANPHLPALGNADLLQRYPNTTRIQSFLSSFFIFPPAALLPVRVFMFSPRHSLT